MTAAASTLADTARPPLPETLIAAAQHASRAIESADAADAALALFLPAQARHAPHADFAVACGLLMEKRRQTDGMPDYWEGLHRAYPNHHTVLRMLMRWYRRTRRTSDGTAFLIHHLPLRHSDRDQAEMALIGLAELRAYPEADALMAEVLKALPHDRPLRMRYIQILAEQSRYIEATNHGVFVADRDKMGDSSRALLERVETRARTLARLASCDANAALPGLIGRLPFLLRSPKADIGSVTFFTGQLGTGGAERQMTRLAIAMHRRFCEGGRLGGALMRGPVDVCVRHATTATGADFYLPHLADEQVPTTVLTDVAFPSDNSLHPLLQHHADLLSLLPEDVRQLTLKLVPHFIARRTSVAYLWQDGGVLSAALGALIAGVPRIVTSFRGLPPNLRPNLFRPEFEPLYTALARLPHVSFTANSQSAANAYEAWLKLTPGTVAVIPNASQDITSTGDAEDERFWAQVCAASPSCTQTVLGVFRLDENKRPLLWVDAAAQLARTRPETRFIVVGGGYLHDATARRIAELGMEDRIFLAGVRAQVGFYLHRSDLLLHLARMEGLPNAVIEAQLAGRAVLATPAGGTGEVVQDGVTGVLLPSAEDPTPDDIAARLAQMMSDPGLLHTMGAAGRVQARGRFLIDTVLDQTGQIFLSR